MQTKKTLTWGRIGQTTTAERSQHLMICSPELKLGFKIQQHLAVT